MRRDETSEGRRKEGKKEEDSNVGAWEMRVGRVALGGGKGYRSRGVVEERRRFYGGR